MRFAVGGRCAVTQEVGEPIAVLWNPHATMALRVQEIHVMHASNAAIVTEHAIRRTTTIGTAGSTVTPDADNALDQRAAPISGALLGLANYSVVPTITAAVLGKLSKIGRTGAGHEMVYLSPIVVPAGTGLALVTLVAVAGSGAEDISFVWLE